MELEKTNCKHCGSHRDNKVVCSGGRHSYTLSRAEVVVAFPYPILTDYHGNILQDGKTLEAAKNSNV